MRKLRLEELNRPSLETYQRQPKTPVVIILDNVRSALNVGSVFRTADAFAIQHLYLCGITAQPPHREILKTAIGATESVNWTHEPDIVSLINQLKKERYQILAIEQAEGSKALQNFECKNDQKYAVIFGNEVKGVSEEAMQNIDICLEVPQLGTKHSLNISVCAGLVLWDFFKQLRY